MADTQHVKTERCKGALVAHVKWPSLAEYESGIVFSEIMPELAAASHKVALDFSSVTHLASAGIGMVIKLHKECAANKGKLVVFAIAPSIMETLKMTRVTSLFNIVDTQEKAVAKLT